MERMFKKLKNLNLGFVSDFGFRISDFPSRICLNFLICSLTLISCLTFSNSAHAWTQTDWSGGDSTFFWASTDTTRYDTGVGVSGDNPTGTVSMSDTGLVGFWDFNDSDDVGYSGEDADADTAYDKTLNNNDGTITGGRWGDTSNQDSAVWKGGLSFDGSGDYVNCGNDISLSMENDTFTFSWWMKWAGDNGNHQRFFLRQKDAWNRNRYGMELQITTNRLLIVFYDDNSTGLYWLTAFVPTVDTWQHVTVVANKGGYCDLYIDGNYHSQASMATVGVIYGGTANLYISDASLSFNGAIDEVRIYNRALSDEEIAAQANAFSMKDLGLTAHWKFDDGGDVDADGISANDSTLSDETSNNNDGTITGCMWGDTSNDDSALFGGGLSFDGVDDYVSVPHSVSLNIGTGDFSISAWINALDQPSGFGRFVFKVTTAGGIEGYCLSVNSSGYLTVYIADAGTTKSATASSTPLENAGWHHVAFTADRDSSTGLKFYIDGTEPTYSTQEDPTALTGDISNSEPVVIGKNNLSPANTYFNGAIDEVRIYRRVLSSDEVADLADSTIVITKSQTLGENSPRGVLLSSTFDADSPVIWKTIEWNDPSTVDNPYDRGESRLRKDEGSLVALWHFDEGEDLTSGTSADDSTVYDESTNSNTGIVNGCKWGDSSEDSAVFQSGLSFDGADDYVEIENDESLNFGADVDFTIEAWIKTPSDGNIKAIYAGRTVGASDIGWWMMVRGDSSTDRLAFELCDGSDIRIQLFSSNNAIPDDEWVHIAVTADRDDVAKVYINGVFNNSVSISAQAGDLSNSLNKIIGATTTWTSPFHGAIDEVAIYNYAKSPQEIWQDARGTQMRLRTQTTSSILDGTGADSPVGLWHFDNLENSSTSIVAYDSSVYGNDGDITNAKWSQYGVFGKCLSFDGSGDYVAITQSSSINLEADHPFTISYWMYVKTLPAYAATVMKGAFNSSYGHLLFETDRVLAVYTDDDNSVEAYAYSAWDYNEWYHIAQTYDSNGVIRVYSNGVLNSTSGAGKNLTVNTSSLHIGAHGGSNYFFNGLIDEVGIYNYARSAAQIKMDARGWSRWSPYYKKGDEDDIVLFADDFNDGVVGMGGYWQDYGKGTWLIDNIADDTGALKITGLTTGDTGIIQANNTSWYNYQVEAKVKLKANTQAGVLLNWNSSGSDNGYAALLDQGAGQIRLYAMDTNGVTGAPLKTYTYTLTADTWYTLKAQYDGSRIRVYMGDEIYITSDALAYTYKGYAGLIAGNAEARFDDFKVFPIDRYCRYEATLTDNVVNDTTPYLYWVRLSYEETTSDDSIWSRIIQDRQTYSDLTPRDTSITPAEFNYTDIDGADTVWCYNLENYDNQGDNIGVPDGAITVNVATPTTASRVDLRLGIRKTTAVNYPDEWPEDIDDYDWSDWRQYESGYSESGDTRLWTLTYSTTNLGTDFATEGGYILQSRAVSTSESTEPDPATFKPDSGDRADTAIIYMMRDITPPGSANTTGGVDGATSASGYTAETCANGYKNTLWTSVGVKGILSYPESTTCTSYRDNTEYVWFNIESSADDSGIRVKVVDQNQASGRTSDCSDLDETDSSIRYTYSLKGGTYWYDKDGTEQSSIPNVADWPYADTNIWTDRYIVIQDDLTAKNSDDGASGLTDNYRYSIGTIVPASSTKGENVLIQFAQKDKAGNWGYSHRATSHYATEGSGMSATKGYYINVDLLAPTPRITAGPREANYSTSASFEFDDNSADDSPLLCAFSTQLELNDDADKTAGTYGAVTGYDWTSYQPWSPTSDEGSATFTDLSSSTYWYRCLVKAKDEALNLSADADSAVYYFQCLAPVPNTIIYSGPAGIITKASVPCSVTFKFTAEGGTPAYVFSYKIDGNDWEANTATATQQINSLGYGNHTFRVRAANSGGDPQANDVNTDQSPASVTFTIEDPAAPSAVAPPGDPVKYWREESE
ncbi:MAG: LamG domain-containing protein [bacterium]